MSRTSIDSTLISHFPSYRRPNLVFSSTTVVTLETGLDGISGDAVILFPDGQLRTETSSTRYNGNTAQNAVFTNATLGSNQGGIRSGSVANNTWYACYATKVTTFAANWVMVLDTVLPTQANYSTLNSNLGTNGWVYLGLIRYGDQGSTANAILNFTQAGHTTIFQNTGTGGNQTGNVNGMILATTASAATLTYSYSAGTSGATIPNNITLALYIPSMAGTNTNVQNSGGNYSIMRNTTGSGLYPIWEPASIGIKITPSATGAMDIWLGGFMDGVLGVGSNPLL